MVGSSKVSASSMLLRLCDVTNAFSLQPPFLSMYGSEEGFQWVCEHFCQPYCLGGHR